METEPRSLVNWMLKSKIYHALYKVSEVLGAETLGDNAAIFEKLVEQIPQEVRHKGSFNMLLLGAATPTSIREALEMMERWKNEGTIKQYRLSVMDVDISAYEKLSEQERELIDFV
jgi:hypothetical protein